jgi:hypothetical protein
MARTVEEIEAIMRKSAAQDLAWWVVHVDRNMLVGPDAGDKEQKILAQIMLAQRDRLELPSWFASDRVVSGPFDLLLDSVSYVRSVPLAAGYPLHRSISIMNALDGAEITLSRLPEAYCLIDGEDIFYETYADQELRRKRVWEGN